MVCVLAHEIKIHMISSGTGVQIGKLYIVIKDYRATYDIVRREGPKDERGEPDPKLLEGLANRNLIWSLNRGPANRKRFKGVTSTGARLRDIKGPLSIGSTPACSVHHVYESEVQLFTI